MTDFRNIQLQISSVYCGIMEFCDSPFMEQNSPAVRQRTAVTKKPPTIYRLWQL